MKRGAARIRNSVLDKQNYDKKINKKAHLQAIVAHVAVASVAGTAAIAACGAAAEAATAVGVAAAAVESWEESWLQYFMSSTTLIPH